MKLMMVTGLLLLQFTFKKNTAYIAGIDNMCITRSHYLKLLHL